ncbi:hypothetical protein [Henriciella litoralis]|nr:hypothetical protein [Henriciella litoralis]
MVELVMDAAANPATAWCILAGAALIVMIEAVSSNCPALWGDMGEDFED